jgi:methionyl-tRNA synthetase
VKASVSKIEELVYAYKLRDAQAEAMNLARIGNKFLAETEPWKLIKTDEERVKTIMYLALQITANLTIVLQPFLPATASKLSEFLDFKTPHWSMAGKSDLLEPGHQTNPPSILFPKIDDSLVEEEMAKLHEENEETQFDAQKDETSFDDFTKMDIRLGKIISAEKVEKADKLLKLKVDIGLDERTVVSGIAEHYKPEEVVGKTVQILINLAPRKIRGIESQGMILMAENEKGELSFLVPEKDFERGSGIH